MRLCSSIRNLIIYGVAVCNFTNAEYQSKPNGAISLPLYRIVNQTAYGVEMQIGNPPQIMKVLVDSGSSYIGLQGTNSNWCQLSYQPCAQYGSYNNLTSTTAIYKNDEFYNALINHGYGDYISDTVRVGGQDFKKLVFGMILNYAASYPAPSPNTGLMGLAPLCKNSKCTNGPITTLQQKLYRRGVLPNQLMSIYLGPDQEDALGSLIYGAVDRAKQAGKVVTIPVIDPTSNIANLSPNYVNFSSMALEKNGASAAVLASRRTTAEPKIHKFKISRGAYALLDTGYPGFALPTQAWQAVKQYFNIKGPSDQTGAYKVDCKFRQQQSDNATLLVGFDNDNLQIRIPLNRLVTRREPGHCVTSVEDCGSNGKGCPFGDTFIRSTYIVFDFDKLTVTLSNVKYTTTTNLTID